MPSNVFRVEQLIPYRTQPFEVADAYGVAKTCRITASTAGAMISYAFLFG